MIRELVCLSCIFLCLVQGLGFDYQVSLLLLILDLFFLKTTISVMPCISFSKYTIVSKFIEIILFIFLRISLIAFFIFSCELLLNLNTCKYDLVLRCLFTFLPILVLYYYSKVSAKFVEFYSLYLSFFLNALEIVFFSSIVLFFVFGFLKLFFAKYVLFIMIISMFLMLISVRLVPDMLSSKEVKSNEK